MTGIVTILRDLNSVGRTKDSIRLGRSMTARSAARLTRFLQRLHTVAMGRKYGLQRRVTVRSKSTVTLFHINLSATTHVVAVDHTRHGFDAPSCVEIEL